MIIDFHTHVFPSFFRDDRSGLFFQEPSFEMLYRSPEAKLVDAVELLRNISGISRGLDGLRSIRTVSSAFAASLPSPHKARTKQKDASNQAFPVSESLPSMVPVCRTK